MPVPTIEFTSGPVKSTDPRKPAIVAALKAKYGARKVTSVRGKDGLYLATVMGGRVVGQEPAMIHHATVFPEVA